MRKKILLSVGILSLFAVTTSYSEKVTENQKNPLGNFVMIPGGSYEIGSPDTEPNRQSDEHHHTVKLSAFDIGETGVTQEQYARITGTNPSKFKDQSDCPRSFKEILINHKKISVCADYPVENINWDDAAEFVRLISAKDSNYIYRLPTEAQQEVGQ